VFIRVHPWLFSCNVEFGPWSGVSVQSFSSLLEHPGLLARKAAGRLRRRLTKLPEGSVVKVINGTVRFEFQWQPFLADEDLRAMFTGSYDLILCDCLKRHLSPGDIVLDVGANVGYVSAVAASYVGATGAVHGFEPLRMCFERLQVLSALNPQFHFVFNNVAVGDQEGVLPISYDPKGGSRNATLVPGNQSSVTENVPVRRLDGYIRSNIASPERIKLIKIDVEGFEFPVLKGLERFLVGESHRPLIVCEIKPWEVQKFGHSIGDFTQYMKNFGYDSYDMVSQNKRIDLARLTDMEVVLFRAC
jgi:FkbM family methyltransferase